MNNIRFSRLVAAPSALLGLAAMAALAAPFGVPSGVPELNPVRSHAVAIGPQAGRLIVGFKATANNALTKAIKSRAKTETLRVTQAQTSRADVDALVQRTGVAMLISRQITPSMHVMILPKTLYGGDVDALLNNLRADPSVAFADVDERRYAHAIPNDPLFLPSATASGQWYMQTPSSATATSDAAATDAVSAWGLSQGSSGTVIADVDNGIRFDHPDLLRAGFGGRLLPGYDFVGQDVDASNGTPQGSFLVANDGDGWDPDPSDPGDWIDSTDLANTTVFPSKNCSADPSSWHGTRVMGVLGALTNNTAGIAGMSWNPYLLPVRALGKCGGLDSDIMAGMMWSAGLTVTDDQGNAIPDNPYPADIINLSLGGSGSCPASYQSLVKQLAGLGVLVVASAGNQSGPVDIPANCPGVLAVAGLRNVGTKVGYSSLGPEVGIAAPAGNCVTQIAGQCLRSIDTTTNEGQTVPGTSSYTDQTNFNLGTSFSAPIVSGIAALMRGVNGNLTPPQLIARIKASATPFPQPPGLAQCVANSTTECACTNTNTTCGAGMVNAFRAVKAALNPIAAVKIPAGFVAGSGSFEAGGSVAACGATLASYVWDRSGGVTIVSGGNTADVQAISSGSVGTLTVIVTDSAGRTDTAVVNFNSSGATSSAPASAGSSAAACVAPMTVTPAAPTIAEAFSPATVSANATATLTVTLNNSNGFALTQSGIIVSLPAGLDLVTGTAPSSTCTGTNRTLTSGTSSVALAGAIIQVKGACSITISVNSATPGTYTSTIATNALTTGPAGGNSAPASADLTVTASSPPSSSATGGGGGGGGALDWLDIMLVAGIFLVIRGHAARVSRHQPAKSRPRKQ